MPQPLHVQLLRMSHALKKIIKLSKDDFKENLLNINRMFLEIELYLDGFKTQKLSRKTRLLLNKFEKGFKELKIYLFF